MFHHFIDLDGLTQEELSKILRRAHALKLGRSQRKDLQGKTLALIFEKPSTRTRVSFEVAMKELGGHTVTLTGSEMQLGHGESLPDTARVLSRFVHALMIRTFAHENVIEIATHASIPVINGLTNLSHPCQVVADLMTVEEKFKKWEGLKVAWCGDGHNNVLVSWMQAAGLLKFALHIACPKSLAPDVNVLAATSARASITLHEKPEDALHDADVVLTDTWISMHNKDADARRTLLQPYQVNAARMKLAKASALFMHCLPAHRGEEVTDDVIDGAQSVVWDEAENRLHAQKAILLWCFGKI
jgi:ornithine carbamoyltransferase